MFECKSRHLDSNQGPQENYNLLQSHALPTELQRGCNAQTSKICFAFKIVLPNPDLYKN